MRNAARTPGSTFTERRATSFPRRFWTREAFDIATENWAALRRRATDCEGLLDCFLGSDVTANYCYSAWCTEKGSIDLLDRPYKLGEALFYRRPDGRMGHVGFVCGFLNGEPLAVEARGIRFGVVTQRLSYDEEYGPEQVLLRVKKPMIQGDSIEHLQRALNALGYYCGAPDGRCGKLTMGGVKAFAVRHAADAPDEAGGEETA